ncbi:MAG TPA: SOS response-associated peptidase family protein, partial [Pseudonocardia sp.]|nr:SOS response-associated peptidase family protein [Pseudonocardia sp.]
MCGRYSSTKAPKDLADEFRAVDATDGAKVADFNVAPTKQVVAVVERHP